MNHLEFEVWKRTIPVISTPSDEQIEALKSLVGSTGLTTLLGMILGARQANYAFLSNLPLGGPENDCAASVIQGKIRGLEMVFDTVAEVTVSSTVDDERTNS